MRDIGKKIRELREQKGLTQEELAHRVGYKSRASINKIELQRDIPISKVTLIAEALGVTPAYIMGWDGIEHSTPFKEGEEMGILIKKYSQLSKEGKLAVISLIDSLLSMSK